MTRTSIDLKDNLWRLAKIQAIEDRTDLKTIVNDALETYLKERARSKKDEGKKAE